MSLFAMMLTACILRLRGGAVDLFLGRPSQERAFRQHISGMCFLPRSMASFASTFTFRVFSRCLMSLLLAAF